MAARWCRWGRTQICGTRIDCTFDKPVVRRPPSCDNGSSTGVCFGRWIPGCQGVNAVRFAEHVSRFAGLLGPGWGPRFCHSKVAKPRFVKQPFASETHCNVWICGSGSDLVCCMFFVRVEFVSTCHQVHKPPLPLTICCARFAGGGIHNRRNLQVWKRHETSWRMCQNCEAADRSNNCKFQNIWCGPTATATVNAVQSQVQGACASAAMGQRPGDQLLVTRV